MRQVIPVSKGELVLANPMFDDLDDIADACVIACDDYPIDKLTKQEAAQLVDFYLQGPWNKRAILLIYEENEIVGLLAMILAPYPLKPGQHLAHECMWWVREDKRGIGRYAIALLDAFEKWAEIVEADKICLSHFIEGTDVSSIYKKRGYIPVEISYCKELK